MFPAKIYKEELKQFKYVSDYQIINTDFNLNELIAFKTLIEDLIMTNGRYAMMTYYFEKKGTFLVYFMEKDFSLKFSPDLDIRENVKFQLLLDVKNFKKIKLIYVITNNCDSKKLKIIKEKANETLKNIAYNINEIIQKIKKAKYHEKGILSKLYIKKTELCGFYDLKYINLEIIKNDNSNYNLLKCHFKSYSMFDNHMRDLATNTYEKMTLILLQFIMKTKIYNKLEINDNIYNINENYELKKDIKGIYKNFSTDKKEGSEIFKDFYNMNDLFPSDTKKILECFYEKLTLEEQNAFIISCSNFIDSLDIKNYTKGIVSCFVAIENLATLEQIKEGKSETEKKNDAIETFIHKKLDNFLDDTAIKHFSRIRHKYAHRGIANNGISSILFHVEDSTIFDYECIIFITYLILYIWIIEKNKTSKNK